MLEQISELLEDYREIILTVTAVLYALLGLACLALSAWQAREALAARRAGNRAYMRNATSASAVCLGLAALLFIASYLTASLILFGPGSRAGL
jgi:hypothetical protein